MTHRRIGRRTALAILAALGLAGRAGAVAPTPPQTPGPFYPRPAQRPADTDWDLVRVAGRVRDAGGEVLHLHGRVLNRGGAPMAGARVEIWQCDMNGRYHHPRDPGTGRPRDDDFQGFGTIRTDAQGRYRFRTIKPVAYPGRTPHIHARILPRTGGELVTQIYLEGHPLNRRDGIYRALGTAQEAATISPRRRTDGDLQARFNFVL